MHDRGCWNQSTPLFLHLFFISSRTFFSTLLCITKDCPNNMRFENISHRFIFPVEITAIENVQSVFPVPPRKNSGNSLFHLFLMKHGNSSQMAVRWMWNQWDFSWCVFFLVINSHAKHMAFWISVPANIVESFSENISVNRTSLNKAMLCLVERPLVRKDLLLHCEHVSVEHTETQFPALLHPIEKDEFHTVKPITSPDGFELNKRAIFFLDLD